MTIATLGDDMVTAGVVAVVEVAAGGAGCSLGGWGLGVVEGLDAGESSASSFACFLEGKHIYQRGEWGNTASRNRGPFIRAVGSVPVVSGGVGRLGRG